MKRKLGCMLAAFAASAALFAAFVAHAQSAYPNKPIRIIVPFPAGGSTDVMARGLGAELTKQMGQPVVVENRPGVNGNLGSEHVAKSPADGYTLLLAGVGTNAINHGLYPNMPYDSNKDFAHVTLLAEGPNVLIVHPSFAAKSIQELVAMAKAQPGKLAYASNGNGSSGRMAMEMLRQATGIDMLHVPYKGGGPSMTDLIGGQVPMLFTNQDHALPQVQAGKVRAIGVAILKRNPARRRGQHARGVHGIRRERSRQMGQGGQDRGRDH